MRLASVDIGNDAVKAFLGGAGEENKLYIPNVLAKLETRSIVEMEKNPLDAIHVEVNSSTLKGGIQKVAVGKLASKQNVNEELTPDTDKSESDQAMIMLLTTLALDAVKNFISDKEDKDEVIKAKYLLSTGLPMDETKRGLNKAFRKKIRDGQHKVTFLDTPVYQGKTVEISFENVLVNTEGFAAYIELSEKYQDIVGKTVLINDIGGLSTDSAIITKDAQIDNEFSDGIKKGVAGALDNIIRKVYNEHRYTIKSRRDLVEIITSQDAEEKNTVYVAGKSTSIKDIVDEELSTLASEEYKLMKSIWRNVPDIRKAYNIGGGSAVLKDYLIEINKEDAKFPFEFPKIEDSIWMIARAYFKILTLFCQKKGIEVPKVEKAEVAETAQ
ncbi:ParM/StbA family protein [Bacillus safensis]|uniref:ParM/StbA family protein n=1 Tax=Bacillus safensis TaxID=561879 RepID=UPI00227E151E|nr:ParM/StbA family protein [Bacillus safensis]MCY7565735.1 ParM/StbA family protein [Bacillus safensis]MCY7626335.1 ParM/StbA family protein [Bacillus safensis]MCY7634628.1 ParM/StbA family protein [Bacillus safensis]MCY7649421.1 ParM/StbA family protein [Bacillus safensis]MCY7650938.1 ParM/StbA family protein [Bacillus safensis]